MMFGKLTFNTKGYDPFIDFIKAYAILCVLVGHFLSSSINVLYPIWGGNQVPLFVAVQCFHYMKNTPPRPLNVTRIFTRVLIPFIVIQVFIVAVLFVGNGFSGFGKLLSYFFDNGGYGQGDYYPFIYAQIALLLPIFYRMTSWVKDDRVLLILFIIICELLEIASSYVHFSDTLYRLLAIRYLFLIYFGWKWAKNGISMNIGTLVVSLLSLASIIYFVWYNNNCEPWFFDTSWKYHRWPCYFFVAELGVFFLYKLWGIISKYSLIMRAVSFMSRCSYDIFLAQMLAYVLFPMELFSFFPMPVLGRFITAFVFSILFGQVLHKFFSCVFGTLNKIAVKDNN